MWYTMQLLNLPRFNAGVQFYTIIPAKNLAFDFIENLFTN